jgi:hypothetical protein
MNANLLICFRSVDTRLQMSLLRKIKLRGTPGLLVTRLGFLFPLMQIPFRLPIRARFYLNSKPFPNSKTAAVIAELQSAGISADTIYTQTPSKAADPWGLLRLIARLPWAISLFFAIIWRFPSLSRQQFQALVGRELYRTLLRRNPLLMPIIISDVGPDRVMLWSAAICERSNVLWWQDDYHHNGPLLYPVTAAAVLNQGGYSAVLSKVPGAKIMARPAINPKPMKNVGQIKRAGVATNRLFSATSEEVALLRHIKNAFKLHSLCLRLHPNGQTPSQDLLEEWIEIAPRNQTLAEFAAQIDLAIVGNSASQLKLVCEGVPVVHLAGLDSHQYDSYGYVKRGYVAGTSSINELDVLQITTFYETEKHKSLINDYTSVNKITDVKALGHLYPSSAQ